MRFLSKIIIIPIILAVTIVVLFFSLYFSLKNNSITITTRKDDSFIQSATSTKYDLSESLIMPLDNGNNLYFLIGQPSGDYCGSGGCTYDTYFGSSFKTKKQIIGFNSHWLDCDTKKVSLEKDTVGNIFGSLTLDKENSIVKNWYHLSSDKGTEEIYHIANDGTPTVIASYDLTCSSTSQTLFRSTSYPKNITTF